MALSERSRSEIYTGFVPIVGVEATEEMLSYFPARDVEEPVTKEFLRAENALVRSELRADMASLREELKGDMVSLREELKGDMVDLRAELRGEMADLRAELKGDISDLRSEMHESLRVQLYWLIGVIVTMTGIILSVLVALH